ncbi:hypothetical protein BWI97_07195 [Siphonobacter sp. BAB-5405]|uniref:hypothetical protein n=1 Tax=Siphonobacter sp. BAB-5405 TaxID=1864825 RepID=UPI000C80B1B6|nr:hypothetical protein [Siphonobacter sp. BAB-5405]PMD97408.1 hypothetical protein BWI97_07195 [Siphonobacter sp. BAB-5405]
MATYPRYGLIGLLILAFVGVFAQTVSNPKVKKPIETLEQKEERLRQTWLDSAKAESWVREKTNHNDHPRIYLYNKVAGSPKTAPYCAAGLYFTATRAGIMLPIKGPAAVKSWFVDAKKVIYTRTTGRFIKMPKKMDVVWLYQSHIEGLAEPIRRDIEDDDYITTVAFNSQGNNPKQGVYFPMRRRWRDVRKVANHITPYVKSLEEPKSL